MKYKANFFHFHNYPLAAKFGIGIICVGFVLGVNFILQISFRDYFPMSLFLGPVLIAAWCAGTYVGLFTMLLGFFIETFLYSPTPFYNVGGGGELARILVFFSQGAALSLLFGRIHRDHKLIIENEELLAVALNRERENLLDKDEALSKLRIQQINLQNEQAKAEKASNVKSLFLANMSHEIRTPLVSILGYAELLKEGGISEDTAKKYGAIIERTGNHLLEVINDILDISKIEAGKLDIEEISFSLPILINEIHSVLKVRSEQKNLDLIFAPENTLPEYVVSDPHRIKQILVNLIGNAIKFCEFGFVKLTYTSNGDDLIFTIQDSGIGIPDDQKSRLFQIFCQGDETIARRYAGTGLGLSLSRQLAHRLGANVRLVESKVGVGSTFELIIPYGVPNQEQIMNGKIQKAAEVNDKLFCKKSILLVEDSVDNQFLIKKVLSDWGANVVTASNGKQAIEEVEKEKFDLILMDMQMPVMDGYTACKNLVSNNCETPIIALTANAMKEDRERCLNVGCRDYVSKPIQKNQLFQAIKNNIEIA